MKKIVCRLQWCKMQMKEGIMQHMNTFDQDIKE
jgi:hypothetical protein